MKTLKYEIGKQIRKFREDRGMSQKELAKKLNISNSRVSNWEQGINRPDVDILIKICQILKVSSDELLNIHLFDDKLTDHERKVVNAYRTKKEFQRSVDI